MVKAVFINLPINNLKASMAFYSAMGFKNNPQFTNDDTACMGQQRHHLCDAAQPPFMAQIHPAPNSAVHVQRGDARLVRRQQKRSRYHERHRPSQRRPCGHQPQTRPRLHVQPRFHRPRWPHLGAFLDGTGGYSGLNFCYIFNNCLGSIYDD